MRRAVAERGGAERRHAERRGAERWSGALPALLVAAALLAAPAGAVAQAPPARALWNLAETGDVPAIGVSRPGATALTLAGDQALFVLGTERRKKLLSIAIDGSSRAVDRFRFRTQGTAGMSVKLDASPSLSGALFSTLDQDPLMQAFTGPPLGPLAALAPLRGLTSGQFVPVDVQVAGDRLFVLEHKINPRVAQLTVRDPSGSAAPVPSLALGRDDRPVFAGDLVAVARRPAKPAPGLRGEVTIQAWRTGAGKRVVTVPIEIASMDLHPDGRIVAGDVRGVVGEVGLDGVFRPVSRSGTLPVYAGDAIVFVSDGERVDQLMVAGPDRAPRPVGVPSAAIDSFAADAQRVVWSAHGCLLVADLGAPAGLELPPGLCPRAEIAIDTDVTSIKLTTRPPARVVVPVRCVAAPATGCRGRVRLTAQVRTGRKVVSARLGTAKLAIAAGAAKSITVKLTSKAMATVRSKSTPPEFFGVQAEARIEAVDPAGRRSIRRECCARLVVRR